jgi:hypothetical protein
LLTYNPGDHPGGGPHYELSCSTSNSRMCFLYLNHIRGAEFHVHALRWSTHDLVGRRDWDIRADGNAGEALRAILEEAVEWANAPAP